MGPVFIYFKFKQWDPHIRTCIYTTVMGRFYKSYSSIYYHILDIKITKRKDDEQGDPFGH